MSAGRNQKSVGIDASRHKRFWRNPNPTMWELGGTESDSAIL